MPSPHPADGQRRGQPDRVGNDASDGSDGSCRRGRIGRYRAARDWLRRRVRFSLRTVLLASIAMAWLVVRRDQARRQQQAVAAIEAAGGWVRYDYQRDGQPGPAGPEWLQRHLGLDFLNHVVAASLPADYDQAARLAHVQELELIGGDFTREDLNWLSELPRLRELHLRGRTINCAGFQQIAGARRLEVFDPGSVNLNGVDLRLLERLPRLRELALAHCDVNDELLAGLATLKQLQSLKLADGDITDAGAGHLARLTELRYLQLSHCSLTDACFAHLSQLTKLRELDLSYTPITGRGLEHLSGLKHLETLDLTNTRFGDGAISFLQELPRLAELRLQECPITIDGIARLTELDQLRLIAPGRKWITDADLPSLKRLVRQRRVELLAGPSWSRNGSVDLGQLWQLSQRGLYDIDAVTSANQFQIHSFATARLNLVQARSNEWRVQKPQKSESGK